MISQLFITRPILETVCSLLIMLAGAVAIPTLPITVSRPDAAVGLGLRLLHRRERPGGRERGDDTARASVLFVFLQNWRSTLIPAITIPVSLIGTFAFMKLLGFSINTLTLFGLVLATGTVVDDAIVVIENIERHMREEGK